MGIDIVDLSIRSFLGERLTLNGMKKQPRPLATLLLYMDPGIFGEVKGLDELIADGTVDYGTVFKKRGDNVDANRTSSNRAAMLLMTADTREELDRKTEEVLERIDILDADGFSRMAR